jgi:hypothetical protein
MKKINFNSENRKFTFTVENEIYNNKTPIECVEILTKFNIKNFLLYIILVKEHKYINYSILYYKINGYEPFGISINKIFKK